MKDAAATRKFASALCSIQGYVAQEHAIDECTLAGMGETALLEKCHDGDMLAVRMLLLAKASVNERGDCGRTPLHHASNQGHTNVVQVLLKASADVEAAGDGQVHPLHMASRK